MTPKGLADVPGVGPYTAAAVASIAFGEPVAAVDGNVIRVCTRLAAVTGGGDAAKPSSDAAKAVRLCADWLIGSSRPGDFNQAMMELGATVCTPKAPACGRCPLREGCAGAALELAGTRPGFKVTDLPEKEKKPEKREERVAVKVVERRPPGVPRGVPSRRSCSCVAPRVGCWAGSGSFRRRLRRRSRATVRIFTPSARPSSTRAQLAARLAVRAGRFACRGSV